MISPKIIVTFFLMIPTKMHQHYPDKAVLLLSHECQTTRAAIKLQLKITNSHSDKLSNYD